jgi:hypothetical protein
MTMRASRMRQARTMRAPKPRREISVAMVTPSCSLRPSSGEPVRLYRG